MREQVLQEPVKESPELPERPEQPLSSAQLKKKSVFANVWRIVAKELISIARMWVSIKLHGAQPSFPSVIRRPVWPNRKQRGAPRSFPPED